MRKFLHNDKKDIDSAIINTARRKNLPPALVEKDFYVCYILDYLSFEEVLSVIKQLEDEINGLKK